MCHQKFEKTNSTSVYISTFYTYSSLLYTIKIKLLHENKEDKGRAKIKKKLIQSAGNKCTKPGCSVRRTHIHHIKEWAVYQTNKEAEMIAAC